MSTPPEVPRAFRRENVYESPGDQDPAITRTVPQTLMQAFVRAADWLVNGYSAAWRGGAIAFLAALHVSGWAFVGIVLLFEHAPLVAAAVLVVVIVVVGVANRARLHLRFPRASAAYKRLIDDAHESLLKDAQKKFRADTIAQRRQAEQRRLDAEDEAERKRVDAAEGQGGAGVAHRAPLRRLAAGVHALRSRRVVVPFLAVVAVMLFAYFVWPTPFAYHAVGSRLVRVNRITGTASYVPIEYPWR